MLTIIKFWTGVSRKLFFFNRKKTEYKPCLFAYTVIAETSFLSAYELFIKKRNDIIIAFCFSNLPDFCYLR